MPPFIPRKRRGSAILQDLPESRDSTTPNKRGKLADISHTNHGRKPELEAAENNTAFENDESSGLSSLSDIGSDEFEDVVSTNNPKSQPKKSTEEENQDEDIVWEDAMTEHVSVPRNHVPMESGNLELNLSRTADDLDYDRARASLGTKKGPTKIERQIRLQTHCMHVQFLLYHNAVRNRWACDKKVQDSLVRQLPPGIVKEVEKWRAASVVEGQVPRQEGKTKAKKTCTKAERSQRDWGMPSTRLERSRPDLSHGDPIISLLKVLVAYWKKRFSVTAPGLRKRGYTSAAARQRLIRSFENDKFDVEKHGERIESLTDFRKLATRCEGSRDIGAQLFAALLRGIGIEARIVASLQPSGFGWTKSEQADTKASTEAGMEPDDVSSTSDESGEEEREVSRHWNNDRRRPAKRKGQDSASRSLRPSAGRSHRNHLASTASDESSHSGSDDAPVIETTPTTPARKAIKYDRDLLFPIYWVEAISPIDSKVIPVSPLVLQNAVASTPEILSTFEPRGAKADKAKQVIAYVVAYSPDGSAKDVTTRYLKRQMWPGKTKAFRIPVEKVPVHDGRGRIKRYEERDWFKTMMSGYVRTDKMRTAVDDVEDATNLVPRRPERKEKSQETDTLQSLKTSADFVLERFLRREEALRPRAEPVRTFTSGKGEKVREEKVYRRADVERCLSAESWHKEGRQVKQGEVSMKLVPIRAVTLTRKREVEEMQRQTGEKPTQGLYSWDQTEYIIPPPIQDGTIPKNSYGNMDCFVPSMVPKGAVHVPMRGTVRVCKKLGIDYAEAVTGFEFGNKLAVPVIEGVVVAEENEDAVREAWAEFAEQQRIKEEGKLEQAVLNLWKRMLMGLRIRERVSDTYGEDVGARGRDSPDAEDGNDGVSVSSSDDPVLDGMQDGGGFLLAQDEHVSNPRQLELEIEHGQRPTAAKSKSKQPPPPTQSITVSDSSTKDKPPNSRHNLIIISSSSTASTISSPCSSSSPE